MTKTMISYRDVTLEPHAIRKAGLWSALRVALISTGFTPVGLLEEHVSPPLTITPEQRASLIKTPDGAFVLDTLENGGLIEVFVSPDRRAFASIEPFAGGPVVFLNTFLEDGTILETTPGPKRAPQLSDRPATFSGPLVDKVQQLWWRVFGKPPVWQRATWPRAGFLLEQTATDDPLAVWRRHQERLDALLGDPARNLRPHTALDLFAAMSRRGGQLVLSKDSWQKILAVAILLLLIVPWYIWLDSLVFPLVQRATDFGNGGLFILYLAFLPVVMVLGMLLRILSFRLVLLLPGPKRRPVSELLGEIELHKQR